MPRTLTNTRLTSITNKLAKKYFHKPINCDVCINRRLRTTGGQTKYLIEHDKNGKIKRDSKGRKKLIPYDIEINPKVYTQSGMKGLVPTIKHELVHWYLLGKGYSGHHTELFKYLDNKIGGNAYSPVKLSSNHKFWAYQCKRCGAVFYQSHRFNLNKYTCAQKLTNSLGMKFTCDGHFKCLGTITKKQLGQKSNKLTRAKANFKHKNTISKHYHDKLFHMLGYNDPDICEITEKSGTMGVRMNTYLGKDLKSLSLHARKQFMKVLAHNDYYPVPKALKIVKDSNYNEQFCDFKDTDAIKDLKSASVPFMYLKFEGKNDTGWLTNGANDADVVSWLDSFIMINYTNGLKLYKDMTHFVKTHNVPNDKSDDL